MDKNSREESAAAQRLELSQADRSAERIIESRALFGDRKEICIEHDGAVYRLKITRQGKLILNK
ncbi:hemin uptake protein HemP [Hoeflea alexandrii]|uniref:hemin uptake protein HemP n=1 Tax=Hoeflea alexandrii TaxID=288436 RepID=UPI0035D1170C